MKKRIPLLVLGIATSLAVGTAAAEPVIIKAKKPYDRLVKTIESAGGTVTHQYKYINAIAADVPDAALPAVRKLVGSGAVRKDGIVEQPQAARDRDGTPMQLDVDSEAATALDAADLAGAGANPDGYAVSTAAMNLTGLWSGGNLGSGIKVAVIDSGIRPGYPHISLDGTVIGGEDFVIDGLGWSNAANGGHGTFVAGMISSNVTFTLSTGSATRNAILAECGDPCFANPPTNTQVPMLGSAPSSSVYALRVFAPTGGAPESRIIAAMEKVLTLRENFDNGAPETQYPDGSYSALDIKVCNMSLGGSTLYAGRDVEDELTKAFLDRDIVLVTSAGNNGPSGSTGGSPGTGFGSLTVGASSDALHERILRRVQFGPGNGALYRPFMGRQMAYFSARGPTADGRVDPEVVANGFASFSQGTGTTAQLSIGSGTSFSAPSVAGVAAVLRQAHPTATAREIRNAIIQGANPSMLDDGSGPLDRGAGHVDAGAASALLAADLASDAPGVVGGTAYDVKVNLAQKAGVTTYDGNVTRSVSGLLPGQRFETYYRVKPNTSAVVVTLSDFSPGSPENALFGNDILLSVHSAKTSAIGTGDYPVFAFTTGGTYVVNKPEEGMLRVTASGDWTNAAPVGVTVKIYALSESTAGLIAQNKILDGGNYVHSFVVPAGTAELATKLAWKGTWDKYPTSDIDLILVSPSAAVLFDGATSNSPERAVVANPEAGEWLAIVDGFTILSKDDRYDLVVTADGKAVK